MTTDPSPTPVPARAETHVDVVVVGAGISGIGTAMELLELGHLSFVVLERSSELGGTWRDNTYPGVAVDIPSNAYCYPSEGNYPWSRAYATGPEILEYLRHVARKRRVEGHIRYGSEVVSSSWDGGEDTWRTELRGGEVITSTYLIAATGLFTTPILPDIEGLEAFGGTAFHSAAWPADHDLQGRHVGVIGTGASAVQIVPTIAPEVAQLTVFQRTPIWVAPRPDYPLPPTGSPGRLRRFRWVRKMGRLGSEAGIELLTLATAVYGRAPFLVRTVQRLVRGWMRRQVEDPETRERLLPDYTLGCKRPGSSNTYLQAFNRPHVHLVTEPIDRIVADGVVTADGALHAMDTLVLATGFLTTEKGNAPAFQVFGRDGVELGDFWDRERLQAYCGVAVKGFPNFFLTAGPYSGGFNWYTMLEAHLGLITGCFAEARRRGATRIEVRADAHDAYMTEMWRRAEDTVFVDHTCSTANSYYLDRHGDPALPLPRTPRGRARHLRRKGLEGFVFGAGSSSDRSETSEPAAADSVPEASRPAPWPGSTTPALAVVGYCLAVALLGGFRADHVAVGALVLGLAYGGDSARRGLVFLLPLILTGVAYDAQRYLHRVLLGEVHIRGPYDFDKTHFGVSTPEGVVTLSEWFQGHLHPALDLLSGLTYLIFIPVFVLTAFYFVAVAGRRGSARRSADYVRVRAGRVMWSLFLLNAAGFLTHALWPTAPPWYAEQYGFEQVMLDAVPDPAGTTRFDALIGIDYFTAFYQKSVNVFGAVPSLHIGWSALALYWAVRFGALRLLSATFLALMCFSAVYLNHHYVVDVLGGILYGLGAALVVDRVGERRLAGPMAARTSYPA